MNEQNRSVTLEQESGNLYRVDIQGVLRKADLELCQQQLIAEIRRVGPVRLLFKLQAFGGWDRDSDWSDLSFYLRNGDNIERIAIVGPEQWRSQALMFAGADLRRGPVEFFRDDALADARAWVSS